MRAYRPWPGALTLFVLVGSLAAVSPVGGQDGEAQAVAFESHGDTVRGFLLRPSQPGPRPVLIHLHGFPGGPGDALGIGRAARDAGWNVLTFSPRGMHSSGGTFSFRNALQDVGAALAHLARHRERYGSAAAPVAVTGWSFGGWLATMAGIRQPEIGCVGAIAPGNMGYVGRRARIDMTFRAGGRYLVESAMTRGVVRTDWDSYIGEVLGNADEFDIVRRAGELRDTPVLVVGGWRDEGPVLEDWIIPLVRALRGAGNDRVTPVVLDDHHGFSESRGQLHEAVVGWLTRECTSRPSPPTASPDTI